jgi:hypothetical protein
MTACLKLLTRRATKDVTELFSIWGTLKQTTNEPESGHRLFAGTWIPRSMIGYAVGAKFGLETDA